MREAFSPGSITLFFEIRDESKDPLRRGSRGVGICVSKGVRTKIIEGDELEVYINGKKVRESIQEEVARSYGFHGRIESKVELPVSQGFGMSGAAALSTSIALASLFEKTYLHAAHIAHMVEVRRKTGLGDVATQYEGGITVRIREGIQPWGIVDRLFAPISKLKLLILKDRGIATQDILEDAERREVIKKAGKRAMDRFLEMPTLEHAIKLAREFAMVTGLISEEAKNILEDCENAAVAMIGNSIVIFDDCKASWLDDYETYEVTLGPRAHPIE